MVPWRSDFLVFYWFFDFVCVGNRGHCNLIPCMFYGPIKDIKCKKKHGNKKPCWQLFIGVCSFWSKNTLFCGEIGHSNQSNGRPCLVSSERSKSGDSRSVSLVLVWNSTWDKKGDVRMGKSHRHFQIRNINLCGKCKVNKPSSDWSIVVTWQTSAVSAYSYAQTSGFVMAGVSTVSASSKWAVNRLLRSLLGVESAQENIK